MKLQNIEISNYQGARSVLIRADKPITLVVGANGAGKSSIRDAVAQAMIGLSARVALKKDYGALVTDGAKAGSVAVAFDSYTASLVLPKGDRKGTGTLPCSEDVVAACLVPYVFAAELDDKERRTFLFDLMGVKISGKTVREKLLARGVAEAKADDVVPLLAAGFEPAQKAAQDKAREAKGAWRAITGEQYGSQKAEGWAPPEPPPLPEKPEDGAIAKFDEKIGELQRQLGALQQRQRDHDSQGVHMASAKDKAGRIPRIEAKLATDREALAEFIPQVDALRAAAAGQRPHTLTCPECSAVLEMKDGALHAHQPTKAPDMEAKAKLPEHEKALTLLENAVKNGERDLRDAQEAQAKLQAAQQIEAVDPEELRKVQAALALNQAGRGAEQHKATAYSKAVAEWDAVDKKTADAAAWHAEVAAWDAIAAALAPDGIPAEFLADAIKPFNEALADESAAAGWPQVAVDGDMGITYGGRAYGLLCESEKWRADAILAAVIAQRSGLNFLLLDRLDVLDGENRSKALYWLDGLGEIGVSALVLGTMKKLPEPLPERIEGVVIAAGQAANVEREAA